MKKRILSVITALALCLTLLPVTAWAIDYPYPSQTETTIGSTTLESETYYLIGDNGQLSTESASADSYNIYYSTDTDSGTHSLTLKDANLNSPIYVSGGTTVTLVGNNVCGSETSKVKIGIQGITPGSITITGTGSYTAYSTHEGIATVQKDGGEDALSDILIQGGTISLPGSSIDTRYGGITITGGARVEAEEISTGGDSNHDAAARARGIVISGTGTEVQAERISCLTTITVSGSAEVTVKNENTSGAAMSAEDGIKILENASVDASGKTGALNSFSGDILIEGTATATLTGQPVPANGGMNGSAAVSVGTNAAPTAARSITVKGKLTVESTFVGIWTWGTGDITIDGGEVSVTTPYYGIMTRMSASTDATGGNLTVQNKGTLTINGAMGTYPQGSNCTLTVDNSTVDITTSSWGLYWPGQIVLKDSTVTCANSGGSNKAIGTAKSIQYDYTDSYKVTAGDSASAAALIPHADLTAATYQNNYVKIEPVPSYSITVTGGTALVEKAPEGATVTITADVPEGQRFVNWTSDDVTFADASAATTTFTMPDSDVTVTAVTTSTAQAAPGAAPELANRTTSSITLKEITANENDAAAEYGISTDGGKNWTWQASPEFTGLSSGTEYTFAVRFGATGDGNYEASPASAGATIATLPNAPAAAVTIDYRAETLTFDSIYEVSTDMDFGTGTLISSGGSISSCVPSYGSEGLTLYVRVKADGNIPAGEIQTFTIPARQQTPTDLMPANETLASEGDGRISGVNEHMEYRQGDTGEWTACTGTTIDNLTPGTYCVRVAATQSGFASAAVTVVIATGAERTYMLNITAPTFDRVYAGYTQPEAQPITIINTGNSDATIIGVTLTGDVDAFILSVKDGAIITAGSTDNTTYTIRPAGGLSAGTYTATITIAYNNDTQASADVSFTVSRRSTGSSTPTYPPTVEKTDNGSTDVAPANPRQGAKVTITPKPDEGYETAGVTVTDSKGSPVKVTDNGDGTWSFIQPASKVDIKVTFVEVETACDGGRDCPAYHLTDVSADAWYHEAVDYVLINGMMSGYPGGLFAPGDNLSRGMLAQILYNAAGKPAVFGKSAFADVADGAWYTDAVIWASRNGIVEGYNGLFAPEDPVTREQFAVVLWRCAGCPAAIQKQLESADADQVSAWALEAMLWAVENGVLKGYNGILNPGGGITRAEAAQMLKNFIENIG